MQPATDNNPQVIHTRRGKQQSNTTGEERETMQHPRKATQQAKTLFDETTQIELVE
jgi:hypothetical protein